MTAEKCSHGVPLGMSCSECLKRSFENMGRQRGEWEDPPSSEEYPIDYDPEAEAVMARNRSSNQRADFERWLRDVHMLDTTWDEPRNCYKEFPAHLAFQAWQAARAAPDVNARPGAQQEGKSENPLDFQGLPAGARPAVPYDPAVMDGLEAARKHVLRAEWNKVVKPPAGRPVVCAACGQVKGYIEGPADPRNDDV